MDMPDDLFPILLEMFVCADRGIEAGKVERMRLWLDAEARQRGYADWSQAYEKLGPQPPSRASQA